MSAVRRASPRGCGEGPVDGSRGGDRRTARSRLPRRAEGLVPDRGSGTVWVVGLMAVVWLMAMTTMVAGGVRAARHRAHAAADGAALAAAARAADGPAVACRMAATVATGTGARLTACTLQAGHDVAEPGSGPAKPGLGGGQVADVSVVVTYRGPAWLGSLRIPARARAASSMLGQGPSPS